MPKFVTLANFTDQGIRAVKDTTKRLAAVREAGKKQGVTLVDAYYTLGQYDMVVVFDAPNAEAMMRFGLSVGMAGNVRTTTLRAVTPEEMDKVLQGI